MSKTRRLRGTLSYANVVSTLCLFLVLGGGMAFAATKLAKNSVGTKQLKKNAVTAAKIKANAVNGAKVKDGSLTGADLQNGSVGGQALKDSSVGGAKLSDGSVGSAKLADGSVGGAKMKDDSIGGAKLQADSVTGAKVKDNSLTGADINQSTLTQVRASNVIGLALTSSCTAAKPLPAGVTSEHLGSPGNGACRITFPEPVIDCAATTSPHIRASGLVLLAQRTAEIIQFADEPNKLEVDTFAEDSPADLPFDLVLVC
ncbi:MAG: hypothetical protein ACTHNY_05700 [Solirubrobacterales bacterium]